MNTVSTFHAMTSAPEVNPRVAASLEVVSQQLEAAFLAEFLRNAGVGKSPETFNGGAGEEQFQSLLLDAYATRIAQRGGLGLAEMILKQSLGKLDA
ncbi:MAG: rod-binding protein [Roseinatronobacter sp.]